MVFIDLSFSNVVLPFSLFMNVGGRIAEQV
ncbi:hypothetical protein TUMEXPCC7403_03350 [Tumidithrix helvetica PCC 7403]